jgi:2-phosphoglycerate kinase
MAGKTFVIDGATGQRIPFLRGVLVESLTVVGLSFSDAYAVAQRVRDKLDEYPELVDTAFVRQLVGEELDRLYGAETRRAYEAGRQPRRTVLVRSPGRDEPFSVGVLSRHLEGCGIGHEAASRGARLVQQQVREGEASVIERRFLRRVVYRVLRESCCEEAANRYLSRCRFSDSGATLIILIGGATGAGKSTVASRLAYLLDIVRTQSTDMMREIIRCYLVPHVAPTLGYSSFDAWKGLPKVDALERGAATASPVTTGFLAQFGMVRVALEATIQRAVKERQDLIVEGVHVLPSHLDLAGLQAKAVVVPVVLAVTTRDELDAHLQRRGREQPDRNAELHRSRLAGIWQLQQFIVDQAQKAGVPVIANWSLEETLEAAMDEIMHRLGERFPPEPDALT